MITRLTTQWQDEQRAFARRRVDDRDFVYIWGLAMVFKLIEAAQARWRAVNAPHLVALVRAGTRFDKGVIIECEHQDQEDAA